MYPSVCMYACARVSLFYKNGFTRMSIFLYKTDTGDRLS